MERIPSSQPVLPARRSPAATLPESIAAMYCWLARVSALIASAVGSLSVRSAPCTLFVLVVPARDAHLAAASWAEGRAIAAATLRAHGRLRNGPLQRGVCHRADRRDRRSRLRACRGQGTTVLFAKCATRCGSLGSGCQRGASAGAARRRRSSSRSSSCKPTPARVFSIGDGGL